MKTLAVNGRHRYNSHSNATTITLICFLCYCVAVSSFLVDVGSVTDSCSGFNNNNYCQLKARYVLACPPVVAGN